MSDTASVSSTPSYDALILGGGAAGLFCAVELSKRGSRVLVLEKADQPGKKILISGGGRCNFTNIHTAPDRYLSANPHFMKSALSRFSPQDFLALIEKHQIAWHEKTLGQLFCDGSARQIVDMLLDEMAAGDAQLLCGAEIADVSHADGLFTVSTSKGDFTAPSVVIATGGPSIPKMGASDFAYKLARQFGLKVVEPRPALVPFTLHGDDALFRELSGVATEVIVSCGKASFREAALFTHKGLSGPAILQISSYWRHGQSIAVDFLPNLSSDWLLEEKRKNPRAKLQNLLRDHLPSRLADALASHLDCPDILASLSDKRLQQAEDRLSAWSFTPNGTEGLAKAEVTAGGISTAELSSRTMEAKRVPGLYAIGEAVDVTGWLGGYNFQWAWASAAAAAEAIAEG